MESVSDSLEWGNNETFYFALFNAMLPGGAILGSIMSETLSRKFGALKALCVSDLFAIVASVCAGIPNTALFGISRFSSGICIGIGAAVAPTYVNYICPRELSVRYGSMFELMLNVGVMLGFALSLLQPENFDPENWMSYWYVFIFAFQGLVALIQMSLLLTCLNYEAIYFLKRQGRTKEIQKVIKYLYHTSILASGNEDISEIIVHEQLHEDEAADELTLKVPYMTLIFSKKYSHMFRLGIMLSVLQMFTGINFITLYSVILLENIGVSLEVSILYTATTGIVTLIECIALYWIVEKWGRKKFYILGTALMGLALLGCGVFSEYKIWNSYPLFVCIYIFLFAFEMSHGTIMFIYLGEILSPQMMGISIAVNWICFTFLAFVYPYCIEFLGVANTFYINTGITLLAVIYLSLDMFETKDKNRQQIADKLFKHEDKQIVLN
jgi:MFS family permease